MRPPNHTSLMNPVLHTERLTLIPYRDSDLDIAIETFTDPEVRRYAGGAMSEEAIRAEMPNWTRRGGNGCIGVWCVTDRITGEKLGSGALLPMPVDDHITDYSLVVPGRMPDADVEVGYFLKPSAWGKGLATEVCRRLLQFAFEESPLTAIVATHDPGNTASRNVLLKAGFDDVSPRRSYGVDGLFYRITREDWLARRDS